jgi:hypothetical protein
MNWRVVEGFDAFAHGRPVAGIHTGFVEMVELALKAPTLA